MTDSLSIKLEGAHRAFDEIPNWLEEGQSRFLDSIAHKLADVVTEGSPKAGIPFHGEAISSTTARIFSNHLGAKALDQGAYIGAKKSRIRFSVGGRLVFMKSDRLPARKYVKKALRKRNAIVSAEFERYLGNLGEA